jgi:palmitoyltransferase
VYSLSEKGPLENNLIGVMGLAGFFGLFTSGMTMTAWWYIFTNMTNIDSINFRRKTYHLAVRVPLGSPATDRYRVVNYPWQYGPPPPPPGSEQQQGNEPSAAAMPPPPTRTYAIIETAQGQNPWHLGYYQNFKEVMGDNPLDWFLPIRRSPLLNHDGHESFYRLGQAFRDICRENGIRAPAENESIKS